MYNTLSLVLVTLLYASITLSMTNADGLSPGTRVPLMKRVSTPNPPMAPGLADIPQLKRELDFVKLKYATYAASFRKNTSPTTPALPATSPPAGSGKLQSRATAKESLMSSNRDLWYGTIMVGTPGVELTVAFDTGSGDIFIPDSRCTKCGQHSTYDPRASETSKNINQTFSLYYGDGTMTSGDEYEDTVTVASLSVLQQRIGSATSYSRSFQSAPCDGLLGLAFPTLTSLKYGSTPFFTTLSRQGHVNQGIFSIMLTETGGNILFGGVDNMYAGDLKWNQVTEASYWQIPLKSISTSVRSNSTLKVNATSIIDTGTSFIVGGDKQVQSLYATIPGSKDASGTVGPGFYTYPCSSRPRISFIFKDWSYTLSDDTFNLGRLDYWSDDCIGAVTVGYPDFWILGGSFLRNVYSVFDMDQSRIGFSQLT